MVRVKAGRTVELMRVELADSVTRDRILASPLLGRYSRAPEGLTEFQVYYVFAIVKGRFFDRAQEEGQQRRIAGSDVARFRLEVSDVLAVGVP